MSVTVGRLYIFQGHKGSFAVPCVLDVRSLELPTCSFPHNPSLYRPGFCLNLGLALLRSEAPKPKAAAARLYSCPELSASHFAGTGDGGERRDNQATVMAKGSQGRTETAE